MEENYQMSHKYDGFPTENAISPEIWIKSLFDSGSYEFFQNNAGEAIW